MQIHQALQQAITILKETSPTPQLDAELLLLQVLNSSMEKKASKFPPLLRGGLGWGQSNRSFLLTHSSDPLSPTVNKIFRQKVKERAQGKPIAYITNTKEFYGREFYVDKRVLIPRPETEELCSLAITELKKRPEIQTIIDVGTGSGCIAITMALELHNRHIIATDISTDALGVAKQNYYCHCEESRMPRLGGGTRDDEAIWESASGGICGKGNVTFLHSNLLSSLPATHYQLHTTYSPLPTAIISNLPYIGTQTNNFVEPFVAAHEPHQALFSGLDGLDHYRNLLKQIVDLKLNLHFMALEIAPEQSTELKRLFKKHLPHLRVKTIKDYCSHTRIISASI